VHFPGLNGLRFLAALSVIIGHVELVKSGYDIYNFRGAIPFLEKTSGHLGVILFFVLSGFLITYLLLAEKRKYDRVSIKKFYIRRVLRIWPLYFLILLIVFLLFPIISHDRESFAFFKSGHIVKSLLLYIFFLPNLAFQLGIWAPLGAHLWSIGVEEQFYLSWPLLVNSFRKKILLILVFIFVGVSLIPHAAGFALNHFSFGPGLTTFIKQFGLFFQIAKFNSMALGGIMAWIYFEKKEALLRIFYNRFVEISIFVLGFGLWILGFMPSIFGDEFYSLLFGIIILNVATKPNPIIRLENKIFDYLGKISYGLYMYHWLAVVLLIYGIRAACPSLEMPSNALYYNLLMYPMAIIMTIGLSSLSYELYEKWFLKLKKKFTKIASG
jgi:peptidoglycan/LPS O-acetylase OafA/YrhL